MKTPTGRRTLFKGFNYLTLAAIFILAVTALALPLRSANSSSPEGRTLSDHSSNQGINYLSQTSRYGFGWMPSLALAESVAIYASDCTTPKSSFAQGETVCAITDGVTLGDGTYNLNWVAPSNTTNGGTITQNPQTFLFALPTNAELGLWKANIGRTGHSTLPDDTAIIGNPPTFTVTEGVAVTTFAANCTTPKTAFVLGETVCVRVSGLAVNTTFPNKIAWGDPEGLIRQKKDIDSDPETDSFILPSDPTSEVFGITVDNRGTWRVTATRNNGRRISEAQFTVSDPAQAVADIFTNKFKQNSNAVAPGGSVSVVVVVGNGGPDTALNVGLVDSAPSGATLNSFTQQSGPTCTPVNSPTCTISSLARGERAEFTAVYQMGTGTGTYSTSVTASSSQTDSDPTNNTSTTQIVVAVGGEGGGSCTVACPDDIETPANTVDGGNNPGAIVHFSPPSGTQGCGTISVDHCNDCFFPQGDTVVTATDSTTNESCSFTVTVTAAGTGTTISCPSNKTANADANECSTNVNVGTATATGTNVTVVGYRSDGQAMYNCDVFGNCTRKSSDAPFPAGTTTITWYAYSHDVAGPYTGPVDGNGDPVNEADTEEAHRTGSATCSQTVKVDDVTPPVIAATSSSVSADANCQAAIPDYSSTVTDNCACGSADDSEDCEGHPHIVYTQTPAAGTLVGLGPHTVHIEATDGSENNNGATKDVTFTVNDTTAPVIDCPDNITTTTDPGVCSAVVNPGTATATDNCDTTPTITASRSDSQALNAPYPKGTTTITWRATDDTGNYSECTQTVTVNDDEAPVITFNGQTPSLWPPNHSYYTFTPSNFVTSVSDNCDSLSASNVFVTKITSDENENGNGDGNTMNDIVIAADCKSFQLRAEREGNGNGRVYTIFFKVVDSSGNASTGTATVVVRKNPNQTAVDSGPHYTVNSSCP